MLCLALINRIMEQAAGNLECVGSDDFLEAFPHHTQGPVERGHMDLLLAWRSDDEPFLGAEQHEEEGLEAPTENRGSCPPC